MKNRIAENNSVSYVENNELRGSLMEIIHDLPELQRQIIMLHYYDELSEVEVAEVMDINYSSASEYLKSGVEKIKTELKNRPQLASFGALPALPFGNVLSDVIHAEAESYVPTNADWLNNVLEPSKQYISTKSVDKSAAKSIRRISIGSLIAVIVFTLFAIAAAFGAMLGRSYEPPKEYISTDREVIVFMGGMDFGENYKHINPLEARPVINDNETVVNWWISTEDQSVIAQGDGTFGIQEALVSLQENNQTGVHFIFFRIASEEGAIYKKGSSFYIHAN